MRAAVCNALKVFFRFNLRLQQKAAWHEVTRGAALRTKRDLLALHVGQTFNARIGFGNEYRLKFSVFFSLRQGHNFATGTNAGLHKRKATKPNHINFFVDQRLYGCRIVGHRCELHLHVQLLF